MFTQIMVVGSVKATGIEKRKPRIRLAGLWLNRIGFTPDSLITAEYDKDCIILKLQGTGLDAYRSVVKQVRAKQSCLFQVRQQLHNRKYTPHLEVKGRWLEDLGFTIGSVVVLRFEYGIVRIRRIDVDSLDS